MTHLHVHSEYSFDGFSSVKEIFSQAKKQEEKAIAVTDHTSVFSWFPMIQEGIKHKIKPLFGIELNVGKYHLTALAKNELGLRHLITLNNLSYEKKGTPRVTEKEIFRYQEGILFLSGCSRGKIPTLLKDGQVALAKEKALLYQHRMKGDFHLELQCYQDSPSMLNKQLINLSKDTGISIIPTNDVHFIKQTDYEKAKNYVGIRTNNRIHLNNPYCYLKTHQELKKYYPEHVFRRTEAVAQTCKANLVAYMNRLEKNVFLPLAKVERFCDASAIFKVLNMKKEYDLANYLYKKIKKEKIPLEDLYPNGYLKEEIELAKHIRGRIFKIEKHPHLLISTSEHFPYFKKNGKDEKIAQIEEKSARELDLPLVDLRKKVFHV